jgi:phage shock protein PspC (stress-responsive transcriptional regulator)
MTPRRLPFQLDRREAKLLGVCAGIGRSVRLDPTFVRIAFVAVPLMTFVTVWQMLLAYFICGLVGATATGRLRRRSEFKRMDERPSATIRDLRETLDRTDRRMMAIDHHLNNASADDLAREIEALRTEKA